MEKDYDMQCSQKSKDHSPKSSSSHTFSLPSNVTKSDTDEQSLNHKKHHNLSVSANTSCNKKRTEVSNASSGHEKEGRDSTSKLKKEQPLYTPVSQSVTFLSNDRNEHSSEDKKLKNKSKTKTPRKNRNRKRNRSPAQRYEINQRKKYWNHCRKY